jgi:hypothetical protein
MKHRELFFSFFLLYAFWLLFVNPFRFLAHRLYSIPDIPLQKEHCHPDILHKSFL